jgi:hypothetical protein
MVTSEIGNGPFNLVVEGNVLFTEHLNSQSPVSIFPDQFTLGDLTILTADAKLWSPRPDWERLHARRSNIFYQLTKLPLIHYQARGLPLRGLRNTNFTTPAPACGASVAQPYSTTGLQSLISNLSSAFAIADISSALTITSKLAGLGVGLTPAGDDFILGSLLAAWIIHPPEIASTLAEEIANTAAPLTTSLSAAWLKSAGRGEAGILWHEFFEALISRDKISVEDSIEKILAVGATSGADALAGFIGTFRYWEKLVNAKIS